MSINASQAVLKWGSRAAGASNDYAEGAQRTTKDQAALAIAAKGNYQAGITEAISKGRYEKGLQRSGKSGWQKGIAEKGINNYGVGVGSASAAAKYSQNSGKYDSARNAANNVPRGPKGSPANIGRVTAVVTALRAAKMA